MTKLYLLLALMFFGLLFLVMPYSEETHKYFLLSEEELTAQTHLWFILQKLTYIIFAWVILTESDRYKFALWVFFGVQVLKFFDYFLSYNIVWFRLEGIPISANTVGLLTFLFAVIYEHNKENGS